MDIHTLTDYIEYLEYLGLPEEEIAKWCMVYPGECIPSWNFKLIMDAMGEKKHH